MAASASALSDNRLSTWPLICVTRYTVRTKGRQNRILKEFESTRQQYDKKRTIYKSSLF